MDTATPLEPELKVFEAHREEWSREHLGKFVVIQDETVLKFFDEYADAFRAGLEKFGVRGTFLVKQIWGTEPVYFVA
ncbi:MAG TPA: hypothetical protein VMA34_12730 [Terracidiphilus sp.]|nr:hypothetical protein [Terracidiphilus sp.]